MSSATTGTSTSNQLTTNYDNTKIFVWENRYTTGNCTNDSYDDYEIGTVMARIASTNELVPLNSAGSDGSQFPVGVLAEIVETGADTVATICNYGDVVSSKLIFVNGETLTTVISGKTVADRIGSDTVGIRLVGGDQLTAFDNQ